MSDLKLYSHNHLKTPVLFLVFNRLEQTKKVFDVICKTKPPRLYIASDGPRESCHGENEIVEAVRDYVMTNINWQCEVKTLFRKKNLGCKYAVSKAITWFFDNEEMGIILEDDCVPSLSFFLFCQELLEKYKNDTRVWHIGGTNPIDKDNISNSYYFSLYNRIWGWASWRRAWKYYDVNIRFWPVIKTNKILYNIFNRKEAKYYEKIFDEVYNGNIDTWDYQWFLIRLLNGRAIIPTTNLVTNIGFGEGATHTINVDSELSELKRSDIMFPLKHPQFIIEDFLRDEIWSNMSLNNNSIINKIKNALK